MKSWSEIFAYHIGGGVGGIVNNCIRMKLLLRVLAFDRCLIM